MPTNEHTFNLPKIAVLACSVFEREIALHAADAKHIAQVRFFEMGLHDQPDRLRSTLQASLDELDGRTDIEAVVLCYGLCGLGTVGLISLRHRIVIPRAHDCITVFMGSKEAYAEHQRRCATCFYYTPGWNRERRVPGPEALEALRADLTARFDPDDVEFLLESTHEQWAMHDTATYVDLGTEDRETEAAYARKCADWLGWRFEHLRGDPALLRDLLWCNWDADRFQIFEPGAKLVHAADESIMRSESVYRASENLSQVAIELESGEHRKIPISLDDRSLADVLAAYGLPLNTRCGQRGLCRGCEVELREGTLMFDGLAVIAPARVQACRARLSGQASIYIPGRSHIEHRPQVGQTFEIAIPYAHQPLFEPEPNGRNMGFAIDVGTTTVVVLLVDLVTGEVLSRTSGFNEQIRFGDNVITRIAAARNPKELAAMQNAIVTETIRPLLIHACELAGRPLERLAGCVIAGNTTMLHILIGEDPTSLGVAPFIPRFIKGKRVVARDLMLLADGLSPELPLQLLPGIAAYIGSDIAAGILSTGMIYDSKPSLLVDFGTNGEIVLQSGGKLTACATAAGPAFEGSGLSCGRRACEGAVSNLHLALNPFRLDSGTIANVPLWQASGLCGSAYVDFLATARGCGLLGAAGRFDRTCWEMVPAQNRSDENGEMALRLAERNGAGALQVSEVDVAHLLQAKAAVGAGIEILLETAGVCGADLGCVYLAGGFGMHLNVGNAIAIGMLPGIREEQVRVVGNTALAGAFLALVDRTMLDEMESLRAQVKVVELNLSEGFEDCYIEHLMLP